MNFYFSYLVNKCVLKLFGQKILVYAVSNIELFANTGVY